MNAEHTPGPWVANGTEVHMLPEDGSLGGGFDIRHCPKPHHNARRIVDCINACEGINPDAVPSLLEAAMAAVQYDKAIRLSANNPEKMSSFCTAEGDDLDSLYDNWMKKSRAAIAKSKTGGNK